MMSDMRALAWKVIGLGARPVLRQHHFKRPGGGSRFLRDRGALRQVISCDASWWGETGTLRFEADQRVGRHVLWAGPRYELYLDLRHGDAGDAAVAVAHWLEKELLPLLEPELDVLSLARAFEARPISSWGPVSESAELWALLGYPEDAARAAERYLQEIPF
jgi:hypothetical protein